MTVSGKMFHEEVERMDKKIYLAAIAGIATLIVFGGCGQEADDTSILFPTPTEIEQDEDFDFEFDPNTEISVTPAGEWEQTTPTPTEEAEPDDEGNLPDEGDLELMMTPIPEQTPTSTPEPTPTKEVFSNPSFQASIKSPTSWWTIVTSFLPSPLVSVPTDPNPGADPYEYAGANADERGGTNPYGGSDSYARANSYS